MSLNSFRLFSTVGKIFLIPYILNTVLLTTHLSKSLRSCFPFLLFRASFWMRYKVRTDTPVISLARSKGRLIGHDSTPFSASDLQELMTLSIFRFFYQYAFLQQPFCRPSIRYSIVMGEYFKIQGLKSVYSRG